MISFSRWIEADTMFGIGCFGASGGVSKQAGAGASRINQNRLIGRGALRDELNYKRYPSLLKVSRRSEARSGSSLPPRLDEHSNKPGGFEFGALLAVCWNRATPRCATESRARTKTIPIKTADMKEETPSLRCVAQSTKPQTSGQTPMRSLHLHQKFAQ